MTRPVGEVWEEYKHTAVVGLRDELILHYSPLVRYVAKQVGSGMPWSVEYSDLISYGTFGLIDAVEKFDPARGIKFETYAVPRIRGAIIDELRSIDWVPRSVRARARAVDSAAAWLEANLQRVPTAAEVTAELGEDVQQVVVQISLDEPVRTPMLNGGDFVTVGETVSDEVDGPELAMELEEMCRVLAAAINGLSEREKTVFAPYYYDGLTLAEIGELLGVTESRVCQIHTKAVLRIRSVVERLDSRHSAAGRSTGVERR